MNLLNSKQTAEALGVSPHTVCEWLNQGIITAEIHEGRCIRFDLENVRAQLARRAKKAQKRRYVTEQTIPEGMVPTF